MKNKKVIFFTLLFSGIIAVVLACKTPVYKYAILNWVDRDYYQILSIYDSSKKQVDIDPEIKKQFVGKEYFTNVGIVPIDISQDLTNMYGEDFPKFIKENMGDKKPPFHIIMNPKKTVIFNGELKPADIPTLIMSPKRKELAEKLSVGTIMLILLESKDAEKNKKAVAEIKKGITKSIGIELDIRSQGEDPSAPPIDKKTLKPITMDYVSISPTDVNEVWFYKQMIKINPKVENENEARVFGVVGRGFVFDQCLMGDYITEEQIVSLALFLSGPCSCTVKAENGGVDILTSWEWDKTIKVKLEAGEEDPETAKAPGFGGEEIEKKSPEPTNGKEDTKKITDSNKAEKAITTGPEVTKNDNDKKNPAATKEIVEVKENDIKKSETKIDTLKTVKPEKESKKEIAKIEQEKPVNESDFLKIILFAVIGTVILLVIITKVMKVNKE